MIKQIFLIFTVLLVVSTTCISQGVIEIKHPNINLKDVKADDQPFKEVVVFKNTGNQPVILTRVTPMTSQLKAEWSREPIAPGKTGEIRISFIPMQMPEEFNYRVMLYSNASNRQTEITVTARIVDNPQKPELLYKTNLEGVKFKNTNIAFNKVFTTQVVSDTLQYLNTLQTPLKLGVQYQPQAVSCRFVPEQVEPGRRGSIIVTFDAPKKNDYGYTYESIILSINGSNNYNNRLTVTANIVEDFSKLSKKDILNAPVAQFEKKEINFGEIKQGEKTNCDFSLANAGKSTLFIRKIKASCGCTAVSQGVQAIAPGQSTSIRATFDSSGKSGRQYKSITVITNDPKEPEITLMINGNVK